MKQKLRTYFLHFLILFFPLCFCACQNNTPFKIVPIEVDNVFLHPNGDTAITARFDYFIVEGDFHDYKDILKSINRYAESYSDSLRKKYLHYGMVFFKDSDKINLKQMSETEIEYRWKVFAHSEPIVEMRWLEGERLQ